MKRLLPLLSILLTLSACGPLPPAPTVTPTPTNTPTATITPSPTATFTPTATPTPSPPEIAAADFARLNFSTEGLEFEEAALESGGTAARMVDKETGQVVYENGLFDLPFVVEQIKDSCTPTNFKPVKLGPSRNNYWIAPEQKSSFLAYVARQHLDSGLTAQIKKSDTFMAILIDSEKQCWGQVHERLNILIFQVGDDDGREVIAVDLKEDWYDRWFK